jgi:hypothetical protein
MAKNRVGHAGPQHSKETVYSFEKDSESGYFKRVVRNFTREQKSNTTKIDDEIESDDLYSLSTEDDYDHRVEYIDIDESVSFLFFKKVTPKE